MTIADRAREYLRHLGMGDLRAPAPENDEFENVGGFSLPKNFHEVVERATQMEAMAKMPGWQLVLDELEIQANKRLAALRNAEHGDAIVIKGLRDVWVEHESRIHDLQHMIIEAVEARDMMLADLSQKYGTDTGDIVSEAKVSMQMKAQLKRDGLVAVEPEDIYGDLP